MRIFPRAATLFFGDVLWWFGALALVIALRQTANFEAVFFQHFMPFTALVSIWLGVFFISGFYHYSNFHLTPSFFRVFFWALLVNTVFSIAFFYLMPTFGITPKTNLALQIVVYVSGLIIWRVLMSRWFSTPVAMKSVILAVNYEHAERVIKQLQDYPGLGFRVVAVIAEKEILGIRAYPDLGIFYRPGERSIAEMIVFEAAFVRPSAEQILSWNAQGVEILDFESFWEEIAAQVLVDDPHSVHREELFLSRQTGPNQFLMHLTDLALTILLGFVFAFPFLLGAILIMMTSSGPILVRQWRIGKFGRPFVMYKFRTMRANAEANGVQWAQKNDPRITSIGRVLRHAHFDETPQLWNVLRGEMSLVGPRPERVEFFEQLKRQMPSYALRHLLRPGITGWAQINYRYGASIEDTRIKLAYDLYYLKYQSLFFYFRIILGTVMMVFRGEGR